MAIKNVIDDGHVGMKEMLSSMGLLELVEALFNGYGDGFRHDIDFMLFNAVCKEKMEEIIVKLGENLQANPNIGTFPRVRGSNPAVDTTQDLFEGIFNYLGIGVLIPKWI
ncbi:MAG: hypothetical protein ACREGC_00740 [Minisyncoccia bacterium]